MFRRLDYLYYIILCLGGWTIYIILMQISFLNDVDIKLILEFKNSFGNPESAFFLGHSVHISLYKILVLDYYV